MAQIESNKAKIAKRVIEVLEFFDEDHPQATVMDIVRRFDRPQSSTSELLSSLVDLGLLHKDPCSRSYSPTPRAAMLGAAVQPKLVRDGVLTGLIDRLSAQTGLGVAVFGMVRGGRVCLNRDRQRLSGSSAGFLALPIWGVMQGGRSPTGVTPRIGCQIHAAIITGRLSKYA